MNKREKRIFTTGLLLAGLFSLFLVRSTVGIRVDNVLHDQVYDTKLRNEVSILGIDDASLQKIGAWPWERDTFAEALDMLYAKGARLVVFDILFLEERTGDKEMRAILEAHNLPTIFSSKLDKDSALIESVYKDNIQVTHGVAHVYPDDDGKVRTIPLSQKDKFGKCNKSLAYQAFIIYSKQNDSGCDTTPRSFLFQQTPPKTYSFIDLTEGKLPDEAIKDKVIFIGSDSLDIEDHFVGPHGEKIPGVYVHASIFTTLLNNSFLQRPSLALYVILSILFLTGALLVIFRMKNVLYQGALIVLGAGIIVIITLLLFSFHYAMSVSTLLFPYLCISLYAIMFRYMMTEHKNSYIKELFGQYVHPKVLLNILKNNDLKLGGEKKYITILFSDIRGFTTLTENMPAEELVETLNRYLEAMSPLIMEREGVIDKYIGDAIMAFWNAPVDVSHHEEKAVRASLHMIEALRDMQSTTPLEIGIGLHAGEAIVGNIGSKIRINYTIIGDAVNACSRLEGLTKKYGLCIITSETIKNAVTTSDIIWRSIDTVRVKGKSEVMKLYEPMKKTKENEHMIQLSDKAFEQYIRGDFKEAKALYKELNDRYSEKMIARIDALSDVHPSSWTGIWDWDEK